MGGLVSAGFGFRVCSLSLGRFRAHNKLATAGQLSWVGAAAESEPWLARRRRLWRSCFNRAPWLAVAETIKQWPQLSWVAVKELNLISRNSETILFT